MSTHKASFLPFGILYASTIKFIYGNVIRIALCKTGMTRKKIMLVDMRFNNFFKCVYKVVVGRESFRWLQTIASLFKTNAVIMYQTCDLFICKIDPVIMWFHVGAAHQLSVMFPAFILKKDLTHRYY
jgi:hypothetical protein